MNLNTILAVHGDPMLKFAANISWLYREWPLLERPLKAAEDGFSGVECLFPYHFPARELAASLAHSGLPMVLINAPAGDWDKGERGLAGLPQRGREFQQSLDTAFEYAETLGCKHVHVMAGLLHPTTNAEQQEACLVERLKEACTKAEPRGITILIEALNEVDVPNYLIPDLNTALRIHEQVGCINLKLQFDLYHQQRTSGDLVQSLARLGDRLGHIQCASVPGRHEPDYGEVDYGFIFQQLIRLSYPGWIGAEYGPRKSTRDGLGWLSLAQRLRPALYSRLQGMQHHGTPTTTTLSTEFNNE